MKKVISVIMAVLMVMSMAAVSVFAATKLADGVYNVPFTLWHATKDQASMGNMSFDSNAKATIKDGKITVEIKYKDTGMDLSSFGYDSSKVYMKVSDGKGGYTDAKIVKDSKGNPVSATVVLPSQAEYTPVKVSAGIPMMGEQDARLKLDWSKAVKTAK